MKVRISGKAKSDLRQIYGYLKARNSAAADRLVSDLESKFNLLAQFPFMGRERSELAANLHSLPVWTYAIFYIVAPEEIAIVRIIDGRMDIDKEFQQ